MRVRPIILAALWAAAVPASGQVPPASLSTSGDHDVAAPPADARQSQLAAAQSNAAAALRASVLALEVGRGLRVGDLLDRTRSGDVMDRALAAARPLGSPRWVDDQTCQVQAVVPGGAVADAVVVMLARYPGGRPPVRPEAVNARLAAWRHTGFSATGASVAGGAALQQARPRQAGGVWAAVTDADRVQTVAAARADAVGRAADDLHRVADPLPLGGRLRGADVLARPAVAGRVRAFLGDQPVTHLAFLDDRTVTLSMAVDVAGLARAVQRAAVDDQPRLAAVGADWDHLRSAVERSVAPVVTGTAAVPAAAGPPASAPPTSALPADPPAWATGTLDADGSAPGSAAPGRLRVKGLAEAAAVARLRDRLLALPVGPTTTLGDAAHADPQLAAGVSRVLSDAHEYHVSYQADGSVAVRVSLDLRDAWDQLRAP